MNNFNQGKYSKMKRDIFTVERFKLMRNLALLHGGGKKKLLEKTILDLGAGWNPISEGFDAKK